MSIKNTADNNSGKLINGILWSFLERFGAQAVSIIVSIILARLIAPDQYGIISAATIFTSVSTAFVTGGFGNALIQKKDADDIDFSSMFIFNMAFSVVLYSIIYVLSPYIVKILNNTYDYTVLIKVLRVLGIGIVFASFNSFYRSFLMKKLLFKKIFIITLIGTVVSAFIGLFLAYLGAGLWALVAQNLAQYFINAILFVILSNYKIKFKFSILRLKPLVSYGGKLMLSSLLTTVYSDINSLAIGNKYNSEDLAYYNKGLSFPKLLVANIMSAINSALFPVMVGLKKEEEFKNCVKKFNKISTFIITPLMFGLAAVANPFISALLTDKWLPCAIYLQISCIDYALQPIGIANLQYWKASGKATLYLIADIIKKIIGVVSLIFALTLNSGVIGIIVSQLFATIIGVVINLLPSKKFINYSIFEQIKDVIPQFVLSLIMFSIVYFLGYLLPFSPIVVLLLQILIGVVIYVGFAQLIGMEEMQTIKQILKKLFKN